MIRIVLASASPRRMEILRQVGITFDVVVSNVPEDVDLIDPGQVVELLSKRKAEAVADIIEGDAVIIAADTVVACNGRIMGKPTDRADAARMLDALNGGCHSVFTGVTIIIKEATGLYIDSFAVETKVWVYEMTKLQIERYVQTEEPMDKAGAYAIQGQFAAYIKGIEGDYYNVMGLPVSEICQRLFKLGYDIGSCEGGLNNTLKL